MMPAAKLSVSLLLEAFSASIMFVFLVGACWRLRAAAALSCGEAMELLDSAIPDFNEVCSPKCGSPECPSAIRALLDAEHMIISTLSSGDCPVDNYRVVDTGVENIYFKAESAAYQCYGKQLETCEEVVEVLESSTVNISQVCPSNGADHYYYYSLTCPAECNQVIDDLVLSGKYLGYMVATRMLYTPACSYISSSHYEDSIAYEMEVWDIQNACARSSTVELPSSSLSEGALVTVAESATTFPSSLEVESTATRARSPAAPSSLEVESITATTTSTASPLLPAEGGPVESASSTTSSSSLPRSTNDPSAEAAGDDALGLWESSSSCLDPSIRLPPLLVVVALTLLATTPAF